MIDDSGEIVGSASTSANVVLEYKDADNTPVAVLVANTNIHIKDFSLVCDDVAKLKNSFLLIPLFISALAMICRLPD